jgi:hypothetical protein
MKMFGWGCVFAVVVLLAARPTYAEDKSSKDNEKFVVKSASSEPGFCYMILDNGGTEYNVMAQAVVFTHCVMWRPGTVVSGRFKYSAHYLEDGIELSWTDETGKEKTAWYHIRGTTLLPQ